MEVTIERILPGGWGLAHAEGKTIMVGLAAPGDRLRVSIDRVKGNVAFASIIEVLEPSAVRVEAPCPYFGRCGGCDFQQLSYQAQLDAKVAIIKDCLRRIARIEKVPDFEIIPAPNGWHYRSRAQWQYDDERKRLGYFESGSRRVCDVAACAVLAPQLQTALDDLRRRMIEGSLPEDVRYFRAIAGDEEVSIAVSVRSSSVRKGAVSEPPAVAGGQLTSSNPTVRESSKTGCDITRTIHGETYRLNAENFFQTNIELVPQLIDAAIGDAKGDTAIELYCGVGLFTLPLARRFKRVVAVEDDADAAHFARTNLTNAGLTNAGVVNRDVSEWLEDNLGRGGKTQRQPRFGSLGVPPSGGVARKSTSSAVEEQIQNPPDDAALQKDAIENEGDFLLLDPPRTGAESRVISGILYLRPKRICYVSCDPATLARDLKKLLAGGYSLDSVVAFDMFSQTHHIETIAKLSIWPK